MAARSPSPSRWSSLLKKRRRSLLRLADRCGARNVRLFGSVARGEGGPKSDVDLLVDMDAGRGMFDLIEFEEKATDLLGCDVDVLTVPALLPSPLNRLHSGRSILRRHEAEFYGRIGNTDRKFGKVVAQK